MAKARALATEVTRETQSATAKGALKEEEGYPAGYIANLEEEARKMREKIAAGELKAFGSVDQMFLELESEPD